MNIARSKAVDLVIKGIPQERLCRQPLCWIQKEQLRHLQRPDKSANKQTFETVLPYGIGA